MNPETFDTEPRRSAASVRAEAIVAGVLLGSVAISILAVLCLLPVLPVALMLAW